MSEVNQRNLSEEKYDQFMAILSETEPGSAQFLVAFQGLRELAESGYLHACGILGELQALDPSVYDPDAAYRWFFISLQREGFSTDFQNEFGSDEQYLGPVGDFRNEPLVSDLVRILGVSRLKELDAQAREWLSLRPQLTS